MPKMIPCDAAVAFRDEIACIQKLIDSQAPFKKAYGDDWYGEWLYSLRSESRSESVGSNANA